MNLKKVKEQLPSQKYNLYCDQRIEKGYCDYDLADFDDYFLKLLPAALYELASKKDHYPDNMFNSSPCTPSLNFLSICSLAKCGNRSEIVNIGSSSFSPIDTLIFSPSVFTIVP